MTIIFFDIDDTLLTTSGASKRAMNRAFTDVLNQSLDVSGLNLGGRTDAGIIAELARNQGLELTPRRRDELLGVYLDYLENELRDFGGEILPGANETLQLFSEMDTVALGVITGNSRRGAQLKLNRHGLGQFFSFGGYGDQHEDRNDVAKDALSVACEILGEGSNSRDIWVIGDTPHDIKCADAIGGRCIAVTTGGYSLEVLKSFGPDSIVSDLFAVPDIISRR